MKIREVMSQPVIRIGAEETVAVAARTLAHYNIGALPVCSVTQSCPTLLDPMNRSTPGLPVHHQLLEFTQTHVH